MQHRAKPGRHRRTEALHRHRAPRRRPADQSAASRPEAPTPRSARPENQAAARFLRLEDRPAPGRHRAPTKPLAPALLGERGRHAVMTAALVAGVGVVGMSSAAAGAQASGSGMSVYAATGATGTPAASSASTAEVTAARAVDLTVPYDAVDLTPTGNATGYTPTGSATGTTGLDLTGTGYAADGAMRNGTELAGHDVALPFAGANRAGVRGARKVKPPPPPPPIVVEWVHPMAEGAVTSCFGPRWGRLHAGVDLATTSGTPIHAAGAGVVVRAGEAGGYGNAVLIDHGNGFLTHYGHMSVIGVTAGQQVAVGQEIGKEGSTGHSTGPHLHFEVHEGSYKNPIEPTAWMAERGVDLNGCASDEAGTDDPGHAHDEEDEQKDGEKDGEKAAG
ncbi:M23 family metallopeptidase [Jidongwangia harbinensis]|uniref:M23 family metallopeptidase n=1 Tax=Jidongwangia harbinensis TaxID=2878561 RepID=UPI001CD94AAC|nr:M23 family metallopeptidase [Jidongwangia harbinensis]MCA2218573.1 M23 family metallopeptidase [Jidongwangia harbinensis]